MIHNIEKKIRKLYNQKKEITISKESLKEFQQGNTDTLEIMLNSQWFTFTPKSSGQIRRSKYYQHYLMKDDRHRIKPCEYAS